MKEKRTEKHEREEKVRELTEKLEAGILDLFDSERYKQYLDIMSRFPRYSANNCVLILMQKPDATAVGGFHHWKKMGRNIVSGEKGLQIIQPAPQKYTRWETARDEDGNAMYNEDGTEKKIRVTREFMNFTVGYVWDYSQTSGAPWTELPSIVKLLDGDVENYDTLMDAILAISPPVRFEDYNERSNGYYAPLQHEIVVKDSIPKKQKLKTLLHECAHSRLHMIGGIDAGEDRSTKECEAESIAYVVANYFGLDSSEYSFGYIGSWSTGKDLPELQAKLQTIQKTACEMITEIENEVEKRTMVQTETVEQRPMIQEKTVIVVQERPPRTISHRRR